ncbi:MAG: substrate-binding domain-containing protein [Oscillospiraceae bacterium]|jgi:phosphate transport system substrate-binding protein|nr:substrate-binding domain-containing protein [Oscillospiraceae bacterium]
MKRLIALLLAGIMLFAFVACNDDEPELQNDTPSEENAEESDSPEPIEPNIPLPSLTMNELPGIDGSTAMIPLAEALTALILDIPRSRAAAMLNFNGTAESYRNLMREWNATTLVLSYEPPPAVAEEAATQLFLWELAAIGRDALVFIVNESNPIESITTEQVRMIYTGEVTNWSELGGNDVAIEPFQRNETSGSQTLFIKLVMGDIPPLKPDIKYLSGGMGPLIESVASFNNTGAAIGFSVFYYAQNMNPNEGLKFLSIDGVAPTRESIRDGSYPHVNDFFVGIAADAPSDSNEHKIFEWLQSDDGKLLLEHEGYVSI